MVRSRSSELVPHHLLVRRGAVVTPDVRAQCPAAQSDPSTPHHAIVMAAKRRVASRRSATGKNSFVPWIPQLGSPMPKINEGCPNGNQKLASQTNGAVST